MTLQQIKAEIAPLKVISRPQLYNHLTTLNIKPLGARQRPQNYPEDSAERIKQHLGLVPVRARNNGTAWKTPAARIPTMPQLRAERKKARGQ